MVGLGWTSQGALSCPRSPPPCTESLKIQSRHGQDPMGREPESSKEDEWRSVGTASPGPRRGQASMTNRSWGSRGPSASRTLQAASFVTPILAVLMSVAALDGRDASAMPALELVSTAGPQCCWERAKGWGQWVRHNDSPLTRPAHATTTSGKNRTGG